MRQHTARLILPAEPVAVEGDETRLTQVLGKLLINSAKYTPEAGEITLALEEDAEEVIYRVCDNGTGIEAALLPRIFDLFSQAETGLDRAEAGLGIGLAVVKGIVELHGGSVAAESAGRGHGAEFIVRLPRAQPLDNVQASIADQSIAEFVPQRVLVADDNGDLAESGAMLLRLGGTRCVLPRMESRRSTWRWSLSRTWPYSTSDCRGSTDMSLRVNFVRVGTVTICC